MLRLASNGSVLARSKRVREISVLLLFAACLTLFTRYRLAKLARAQVEEQHSCVQPKPTRSTVPIAQDVDAVFDRAINAINADKLKRYAEARRGPTVGTKTTWSPP